MTPEDQSGVGIGARFVQNIFKQKKPKSNGLAPSGLEDQLFTDVSNSARETNGQDFLQLFEPPQVQVADLPVERPQLDFNQEYDLSGQEPDIADGGLDPQAPSTAYPEGSDAQKILSGGNSFIHDPETGAALGVKTRSGGVISIQEALKGISPENILSQNGFHDTPENVQTFLRKNPDLTADPRDLNFTELRPTSNKTVVDSPSKLTISGILTTSATALLSGAKGALDVAVEGLQRWEALKASLLDVTTVLDPIKRYKEIGGSLFGKTPTEFPDAKLRSGQYKELGDIYRKLGFPEWISATLGLGADVASDLGIGAGTPGAIKAIKAAPVGEKLSAKFAGAATVGDILKPTEELLREKVLQFRSNTFVRDVENTFKGKSRLEIPEAPGLQAAYRQFGGEAAEAAFITKENAEQIDLFIKAKALAEVTPELQQAAHKTWSNHFTDALTGSVEATAKLPVEAQAWVKTTRGNIDKQSNKVKVLLTELLTDPSESIAVREARKNTLALKFGIRAGKELPIDKLVETIAANEGSYLKRFYRIFQEKNYKPGKELIDGAVNGLRNEFPDQYKTIADAEKEVERILTHKTVSLRDPVGNAYRIDTGSFIARQKIPPYLRELMGEIKNPAYVATETTRSLAETADHMQLFKFLKEIGAVVSPDQVRKGFTEQLKGGNPLQWSYLEGMYTTPEIASFIKGLAGQKDALDVVFGKLSAGLKTSKTILNLKSHIHNITGNALTFSTLAGISPFNPKNHTYFKQAGKILNDLNLAQKGKIAVNGESSKIFKEMLRDGIVGTELPVADNISFVQELVNNPFGSPSRNPIIKGAKDFLKFSAEKYSQEDQIFKMATYLKHRAAGKTGVDAAKEVYKWFPNYREAGKLADYARSSATGVMFLNPFMTFKTEAHRIFLNAIKESPQHRVMLGAMMGSRLAWNTAMLSFAGKSLSDIREFYMTKSEAASETFLNPLSKEFDVNVKYVDPFNTSGVFAPLMAYAGATGVSPFDYLLDFTNMSADFGYSNLLVNALEPAITGRGRFGEDLTAQDRIGALIKGVAPSSLANDLPKILDNKQEPSERARRVLRFSGVDVEKRSEPWIKKQASRRLSQRLDEGVNIEPTLNAIEELGFDSQGMLKKTVKKKQSIYRKEPDRKKETNLDRALSILEQEHAR